FMTKPQFSDLLFYVMLGVILGGRLGYMIFYGFDTIINDPLQVFYVWQGGMSFHGGLLGVISAVLIFCCRFKFCFFEVTDFIAPLVPLGIFFGRCANFINAELWGRATDVPWAVIFPYVDSQPRHPSQIYEMLLEGALLFIILNYLVKTPYTRGFLTGAFLLFYSIFRMFLELFREPDQQLGFLVNSLFTMGQILSFPMLVFGIFLIVHPYLKFFNEKTT
ncbi:MAG: prolipoprotein diacylglyceryl transferase, partial [Pseudomonadota bacterium]|nr:prolipoprotein diacylglyceryl transferase [Pseudomonadota bacterium]